MICLTLRRLLEVSGVLVTRIVSSPDSNKRIAVSMQTVSAAVGTLVSGLSQVQSEIKIQRQSKTICPDDRFVQVMEVCDRSPTSLTETNVPFSLSLSK